MANNGPEHKPETDWETLAQIWGAFFQNVTTAIAHTLHTPTPPLEPNDGLPYLVVFRAPSPLPPGSAIHRATSPAVESGVPSGNGKKPR